MKRPWMASSTSIDSDPPRVRIISTLLPNDNKQRWQVQQEGFGERPAPQAHNVTRRQWRKCGERILCITNKGNWRFYKVGSWSILSIKSSARPKTRHRAIENQWFIDILKCSTWSPNLQGSFLIVESKYYKLTAQHNTTSFYLVVHTTRINWLVEIYKVSSLQITTRINWLVEIYKVSSLQITTRINWLVEIYKVSSLQITTRINWLVEIYKVSSLQITTSALSGDQGFTTLSWVPTRHLTRHI